MIWESKGQSNSVLNSFWLPRAPENVLWTPRIYRPHFGNSYTLSCHPTIKGKATKPSLPLSIPRTNPLLLMWLELLRSAWTNHCNPNCYTATRNTLEHSNIKAIGLFSILNDFLFLHWKERDYFGWDRNSSWYGLCLFFHLFFMAYSTIGPH